MLPRNVLLVRSGKRLVALPLGAVVETMRPLPIEPLAPAPDFVAGLSLWRGAPTPVVDLRVVLGDASNEDARRMLGLRLDNGRPVGVLVDEVIGVRDAGAFAGSELPPLLEGAPAERVSTLGSLDGELLTVLEVGALVPPQTWAALEQGSDT